MSDALVGREPEVAELSAALGEALDGRGNVVLLSGEPGIGKSRLLEELAGLARAAGADVAVGRSWEAGGAPPYWPWTQALRAHVRGRDPEEVREDLGLGGPDVAQIVPDIGRLVADVPRSPSGDPEQARFRVFDATVSFLRAAAGRRPLVLVLDDLHAADTPSLLLLRFLARELSGSRLLVAGGYRDTDLEPGQPLSDTVGELLREPGTRRLVVSGLTLSGVAAYLEPIEGIPVSPGLTEAIHAETEGNPLFVVEVVRLLAAEGGPRDHAGSWRLRIPQSVREVIRRRLARLSVGCTRLLTAAAVFGRDFGLEAVAPLLEVPRDELLPLIDEATLAGVVEEVPGVPGRFRFAHILIRESLHDDISPSQRPRMHRAAGRVLEELYAGDVGPHLAELAHHFFEGAPEGDAMRAVRYARLAGERALTLLAHEEAVRLFGMTLRALDLADDKDPGELDRTRAEVLVALGDAQARSGEKDASRGSFLRAAEMARGLGRPEVLARAALGYGGRFVWEAGRGDPDLPALLRGALDALPEGDSELRVRVMARLAGGPMRDDPVRDRRDRLSRQAVEMARRLGDASTLAYVLDGRYAAVWWPENLEERVKIARELVSVAASVGDLERELQGHHYLCLALLERGDVDGMRAELRAQERIADRLRQPTQRFYITTVQATLALFEGRFDEAEGLLPRAFEEGSRAEGSMAEIYRAMQLAALRAEQGRGEEALEPLSATEAAFPTYLVLRCLRAWLLAAIGRMREAAPILEDLAGGGFAAIPRNDEWVFSMTLLGEVAARLGDAERSAALLDLLRPYGGQIAVSAPDVAGGAVDRVLGLLAASLERWPEADRRFEAALELNERSGARPWAAWTRHDHAVALLTRGAEEDRARAFGMLRAALRSAVELGMRRLEEAVTQVLRRSGEAATGEPSRTIRTFMFTDIVGSTTLVEAMGDEAWQQMRGWHDRTLRTLFAEHVGEEVDHAGDGFFVAFPGAGEALACAVDIQRRLDEHRATAGFAPQVRIGLHTAEASITDEGYAGKGVHEAARIAALAEGSQVLVSEAAVEAVGDPAGFAGAREARLRGIAEPTTVWSFDWRR